MSVITIGRITAVNTDTVVVQCSRVEACGMCAQKNSCSVSTVSRVFSKEESITLPRPQSMVVEVNQLVAVKTKESTLIRAILLMFLVPLISAVLFALIGAGLDRENEEWHSISGLGIGAVLGFLSAGIWSRKFIGKPQYELAPVSSVACKNLSS